MSRLVLRPQEAMVGESVLSFIPRLAQKGFVEKLDEIQETRVMTRFNYVFITKAGYLIDLDITVKALRGLREANHLFFRIEKDQPYQQNGEPVMLVGSNGEVFFYNAGN